MIGSTSRVEADFQVHLFQDGPVNVILPLTNVRLRDALLDSAPVLAVPNRQPEGLAISVAGAGRHLIHLTWESPVRNRGDELELYWTVPPIAASRLTVSLPAELATARVAGVRGGQWRSAAGGGTQLEADLGRIIEVSARWRPAGPSATIGVREAYLVEVQPQEARIRGALRFEVSRGATTRLRFRVPAGLIVQGVEARAETGESSPPRLQSWSVGPSRELALDFSRPISGNIRVHLDLLIDPVSLSLSGALARASAALGDWRGAVVSLLACADPEAYAGVRSLAIPWPAPLNSKRTEAFWAYRTEQCLATVPPPNSLAGKPADKLGFARIWPPELGSLNGAQGFASLLGDSAALVIRPQLPRVLARQQLTVGLGVTEADLQAKLELSVTEGTVGFLAWQLPDDLTIADVQGSDVLRWSRQGTILQIWLKRGVAASTNGDAGTTTINLSGWLPQVRKDKSGVERLVLPRMRVVGAQSQTTAIDLVRRRPMTIALEGFTHLRAQTTANNRDDVYGSYVATQANYSGTTLISPLKTAETPPPGAPASPPATSPAVPPKSTSGVQVLLAEYVSQLDAMRHVVHEARYLLVHDAGADWKITLPENTMLLSVALAGERAEVCSKVNSNLRIALPAAAGWCEVTVRWSETAPAPNGPWVFCPPRFGNGNGALAVWTLQLPATLQMPSTPVVGSGGGRVGTGGDSDGVAWQCLTRAEALLRAARMLAGQWNDANHPLHTAQMARLEERFYGQLREASRLLDAAGAADVSAATRLAALQKDNQRALKETCWESLRQATETVVKELPLLAAADRLGKANSLVFAFSSHPEQIVLPLATVRSVERQKAVLASVVVTLLAAGVLLIQWRQRKS